MKQKDIQAVLNGEKPLIDVWHYFIGNYRYTLYYWKVNYSYTKRWYKFIYRLNMHKLIREHIRKQIAWRIAHMDKTCYNNGECRHCGCQTTALQMAAKSCEEPCYPRMMSKKEWKDFNKGYSLKDASGVWLMDLTTHKPKLVVPCF